MRPVALRGLEQCGPAFTYIGVGMMVHPFSWGDLFWLTQVQFPAVLRLFQDGHGFLLVSRFTAYKESLSLPILKGKTHYRPMARRCAPQADKSAMCTINRHLRNGRFWSLRQGSNERDRSTATVRSSPVILSAAKDLAAARGRPFAALSVTGGDCSNGQIQFLQIEPFLKFITDLKT